MTARIWIGGELRRSVSHELVLAVQRAGVSTGDVGFEHIRCQPVSIEGLLESRHEGRLRFMSDDADGLDDITATCRRIGVTYRLWRGPTDDEGATIEVWWPGLLEPVRFCGDPTDPHVELVEAEPVRRAIKLLEQGKQGRALHLLQRACPSILDVPPIELVEE
jgi:hypothetical protein